MMISRRSHLINKIAIVCGLQALALMALIAVDTSVALGQHNHFGHGHSHVTGPTVSSAQGMISIGSRWDRGPVNHSWRPPLRTTHNHHSYHTNSIQLGNFVASHYAGGTSMLPSGLYRTGSGYLGSPSYVVSGYLNHSLNSDFVPSQRHFAGNVYYQARDARLAAKQRGHTPWVSYFGPTVYGNSLLMTPPAYARNADGAVFVVPTIVDPAFGGGLSAGYWPYYESIYGCVGPLPTYGFASPVWPGFGFVPSIMSFQVGVNGSPGYPMPLSSASYNVISGGSANPLQGNLFDADHVNGGLPLNMRVNPMPPAFEIDPAPVLTPPAVFENPPPRLEETLEPPIINEFPSAAVSIKEVSAADRIQSIRYQATGDASFRKGDYASAEVFYRTAMQTAPTRQAPYMRLAFVLLARHQFDKATGYLKAGLLIEDDPTRGWISARELYGRPDSDVARHHANQLWQWVERRPLSTDRLLLAGVFQKFRGNTESANEFFQFAMHRGSEIAYVAAAQKIGDNILTTHNLDSERREFSVPQLPVNFKMTETADSLEDLPRVSSEGTPADRKRQADGIYMRGSALANPIEGGGDEATPPIDLLRIPVIDQSIKPMNSPFDSQPSDK